MWNYKAFPFIWFTVLVTVFHCLFVSHLSHRTSSETILISSTQHVHDVRGEVRDSSVREFLPQIVNGSKHFCALMPRWALVFSAADLLPGSRHSTALDYCLPGITTYRLFIRKFPPPEPDDDFLVS